MERQLVDAYLRRLGVEAEPPSAEALARIHRAHAERVPYETVWIHLGQRWGIDPSDSATRIATSRRGGYCFHLNGGLSELLGSLGYRVTRHVGGVHGPGPSSAADLTNHLVLVVHDLPTDANPTGAWYADVGLGDALHEPVPLAAGSSQQGPFRLTLEATPGGVADWHLAHDPAGSFLGMAWRNEPTAMDAFAERHDWLSTSPGSGFVRFLVVGRRGADHIDLLKGLSLRRIGAGAAATTVGSKPQLLDALGDVFGLDLSGVEPEVVERMWAGAAAAHERWVASQDA
jgi:arylamine N-acetyltransferase